AGATRVTKPPLLSGLLRCGVCAGSMTVRSQVQKRGKLYRCFGCTTRWTRGAAICTNSRMLSELRLQKVIFAALQRELLAPELVDRLVQLVEDEYEDLHNADQGTRELEQILRTHEQRVRNATEALVKMGWSEALAAALKDEEAQVATLRARLAEKRRAGPRRTLEPDLVRTYVHDLLQVL